MGDTMISNDALAAAVAAAAEIAKNGGGFLFQGHGGVHPDASTALSLMFPAAARHFVANQQHHAIEERSYLHGSDDDDEQEHDEEDAERRMAKSRERNREHARRTRLRKKAQLEKLQQKVKGLEAESRVLKQSLEECNIASILVGLSSKDDDTNSAQEIQSLLQDAIAKPEEKNNVANLVGSKRRRFSSDAFESRPAQPLQINIDGQTTLIGGGRTHINWKSGVYSDEKGDQKQLTQDQLESLRRERNRMHAKMTRDRKKSFIATIEKTIEDLEKDNQRMRDALLELTRNHFKQSSSTSSSPGSPEMCSVVSSDEVPTLHVEEHQQQPRTKKVRHGFTLIP